MPAEGRFKALFSGYEMAHGKFIPGKTTENGKVVGQAFTLPSPPTLALYAQHLAGTYGLGIIPFTGDFGCWFGAIDVDTKDENGQPRAVDVPALARKTAELKLPFVVCETKSGGAHLYVFFAQAESALRVRRWLAVQASVLGHGRAEIFPKQHERAGPDDYGNWINLPYWGGRRRALTSQGEPMELEAFLDHAEKMQWRLPDKEEYEPEPAENGLFAEGPPCLNRLEVNGGLPSGGRNDGMLAVGVYLKKRYGDDWRSQMAVYNARMCSPALDSKELGAIEKSLSKRDYGYRCSQPPIASHCNRRACLKRRWGVGQTSQGRELTGLTFYRTTSQDDPVYVALEIGGRRMMMPAADLFSAGSFNRAVWTRFGFIGTRLPQPRWQDYLERVGTEATEVVLPPEAGEAGYLWVHLEDFLAQKAQAKVLTEVLLGKPFVEGALVWFRMADVVDWLRARRVDYGNIQRLTHAIRDRDGQDHTRKVGGRAVRLWHLPAPEKTTPEPLPAEEPQEEVF